VDFFRLLCSPRIQEAAKRCFVAAKPMARRQRAENGSLLPLWGRPASPIGAEAGHAEGPDPLPDSADRPTIAEPGDDTMHAAPIRKLRPRHENAVMECQDNLAFMRPLPNEMIQLIVTSPRYNIGKSYEVHSSLEAYIQAQAQAQVISECVRVLRPRGSIC
jgi:hypothetical protein